MDISGDTEKMVNFLIGYDSGTLATLHAACTGSVGPVREVPPCR